MNRPTPSLDPDRPRFSGAPRHHGGFALLLVMIALAVAVVLAASFLASQSTSTGVAKTIEDHTRASLAADSAIDTALAYVQSDPDWRTRQTSGQAWVRQADLADGQVTITGSDGIDDDGDDDLANNDSDPVTLTVVGRFNGSYATAKAATYYTRRMVMIVPDAENLWPGEADRLALFRDNRWEVRVMSQDAPDAELGAAMGRADSVYVASRVDPAVVNTRLNATTAGIVCANPDLAEDLKLTAPPDDALGGLLDGLLGGGGAERDLWIDSTTQLVRWGLGTYRYPGTLAPGTTVFAEDRSWGQPSMIGIDTGGQDFGDRFVIEGGRVVTDKAKAAEFTVVGVGFSVQGYKLPVTVQFQAGGSTYDPFGPVDDPAQADVNDDDNPRQFIVPDKLKRNTALSVTARSWMPDRNAPEDPSLATPYMTVRSADNSANVKVLRDGDPAPNIQGYDGQADAAAFIADYIDPDTHKVTLASNQAIYLFELATNDMSSDLADFQDIVVVVSLAKEPGELGSAAGRRLCLPFGDDAELTDAGQSLLLQAVDWGRNGRHGPYVVRWLSKR